MRSAVELLHSSMTFARVPISTWELFVYGGCRASGESCLAGATRLTRSIVVFANLAVIAVRRVYIAGAVYRVVFCLAGALSCKNIPP